MTIRREDEEPAISRPNGSNTETTPLLPKPKTHSSRRKWPKSLIYRVLVTSFLVSVSFSVTQVPLIYVFGVMTCEDYYRHHDLPPLGTPAYDNRCRLGAIEASTARSVAVLGAGTTFFGVANLFVTGWCIKVLGVKTALLIDILWPAIRLVIQNIGVMVGAGKGILIVEASQIITIIGGPAGYLLALNSYATEIVLPYERTGTLGRLQGCAMFGTGLGFLSGGLLSDWFGMLAPFRITLLLFCISTLFAFLFLPTIPVSDEVRAKASKNLSSFFEPLKMFTPQKWELRNGVVRREYGVLLLGCGAFLAVFATGYIPTLLQMFATDIFDFGTSANSELISLNFFIRAAYLTFAFPTIITFGRKWLKNRDTDPARRSSSKSELAAGEDVMTTDPDRLASIALPEGEAGVEEPHEQLRRVSTAQSGKSAREVDNESYHFDLFYTRYSLIVDGILTSLATFVTEGWQLFVVAAIIPLAAGTGSASKGTMLQMCTPEQRTDALSAITLLESMARLSTTSLFGLVFAAFAEAGRPSLTFAVNGAVACIGFIVLLFARFPPHGAVRYGEIDEEDEDANK